MRKILFLSFIFLLSVGFVLKVSAQTADVGIKLNYAGGEVTSVSAGKIGLMTKDGAIEVILSNTTEFKRVPPENPSLKAAVASSLAEIGIGDKILVTGLVSEDKKTIPAKAIYLLTKSDIAQKAAKEQEQWRTRGISGKITAINPQSKEITISSAGLMGAKTTVLTPKTDATFKRYAQDSVSYNESVVSKFEDLTVGDFVRAVGDKSEDGATFKAEQILSGAFQTTAGTITAINAEKGEITVNNLQTKKDVVIVVGKNSILKQFPTEMAQRMAQAQATGGGNVMRPPNQQNNQNQQQQNPTQGGGINRGGGSLDDMLDRFPNIAITDLKVGEMIAVSSSKSSNLERVTAIKLLSGVEPFLRLQQMSGGGNRQGGGANSSFSIPGLDGAGFP
ncbi:hypothetical protein BH10ACI1_BH10ACI1_27620 [soil metagenome]